LIARCAATADVERSVAFARANELPIAVRAGGHSTSGDSFCDGGMVIDVSAMKRIEVNAAARTARADAGLTASEFDRIRRRTLTYSGQSAEEAGISA
jgi:FAD/FMN-containing dehydrogenase